MTLTPINLLSLECVWPAGAVLGEGPLWDDDLQTLWWTDIKGRLLHRYAPATGTRKSWHSPQMIGCFSRSNNNRFLAATDTGIAWMIVEEERNAVKFEMIAEPETDQPGNRFNDGKCDPAGRFWMGSMDNTEQEDAGNWWILNKDLSLQKVDSGYGVTNGPAFDEGRARVYLTDSKYQRIFMADVTGDGFANKSLFKQFEPGFGYPDGMTVDRYGGLWIAFWAGSKVCRLDPETADVTMTLDLPVLQPTSIVFGGAEGRTAFVTSAAAGLSGEALEKAPLSGGLFRLEFDVPLAQSAIQFDYAG